MRRRRDWKRESSRGFILYLSRVSLYRCHPPACKAGSVTARQGRAGSTPTPGTHSKKLLLHIHLRRLNIRPLEGHDKAACGIVQVIEY